MITFSVGPRGRDCVFCRTLFAFLQAGGRGPSSGRRSKLRCRPRPAQCRRHARVVLAVVRLAFVAPLAPAPTSETSHPGASAHPTGAPRAVGSSCTTLDALHGGIVTRLGRTALGESSECTQHARALPARGVPKAQPKPPLRLTARPHPSLAQAMSTFGSQVPGAPHLPLPHWVPFNVPVPVRLIAPPLALPLQLSSSLARSLLALCWRAQANAAPAMQAQGLVQPAVGVDQANAPVRLTPPSCRPTPHPPLPPPPPPTLLRNPRSSLRRSWWRAGLGAVRESEDDVTNGCHYPPRVGGRGHKRR